jgi:hypothetical protein
MKTTKVANRVTRLGDIFRLLVIVCFVQLFEKCKSGPNLQATFSAVKIVD